MNDPNFIIIGSQKAGTTSMHHVLQHHPDASLSTQKELNFFFHEENYSRGVDYYRSCFSSREALAVGEASPGYICHPEAPRRIADSYPHAKLILTVRNPIDRAYSQYWHSRRNLNVDYSFEEAAERFLFPIYVPGEVGYFSRGLYSIYLNRYREYFNDDQILVLKFEDIYKDENLFYKKIFEFLGIDPSFDISCIERLQNPASIRRNLVYKFFFKNPYFTRFLPSSAKRIVISGTEERYRYPKMNTKTRERLVSYYKPFNSELAEISGLDLSDWS